MTELLGARRVRTVTLIPETPTGAQEAWSFDLVTDMSETHPGQAFRHPLQNGEEGITDGVTYGPPELSVTGLLTDTPANFFIPREGGSVSAYQALISMRAQGVPITVVTSWAGTGKSRWPEVITGQHGAAQGASISVTANFVKFNIVKLQLTSAELDSDVQLLGSQEVIAWDF